MEELQEVLLTTLAYGGDALGRLPDGQVVFVPFGLPGEKVRVHIQRACKRGPLRAEIVEVLEPSPDRVHPRCIHFGICGGCHYQHMGYEAQRRAKADILRDQLVRIGKLEDPPVGETVPSPAEWSYRNNVQFHLTPDGKLGYVRHRIAEQPARGDIFAIRECHLPEPALNELWPQLEFEAGSGIERVSVRAGDDLMVILESDEPQPPEVEIESGISAIHLYEENPLILAGNGSVTIEVLGRAFRVSAPSFFQVNTAMAARMVEHVLALVPVSTGTILDLYCGAGLFSSFLASRCQRLVGVESSASACEDFAANLDEYDNVELYEGRAEDILPSLNMDFDLVLVDPPRAGLYRRVLDVLVSRKPARLVYVSCDPSTLARDAKRLIDGGYQLVQATPFDLFPQTYHIETIAWMSRVKE
jgi:23S rRNA (uracil1939-C5)-methyltransferase